MMVGMVEGVRFRRKVSLMAVKMTLGAARVGSGEMQAQKNSRESTKAQNRFFTGNPPFLFLSPFLFIISEFFSGCKEGTLEKSSA